MKEGDIVRITVEHPSGATVDVKNRIGMINFIKELSDGEVIYGILIKSGEWAFIDTEFVLATEKEIKEELQTLISWYYS